MNARIELNHDELVALQTAIVVEGWNHKSYGKGKRKWLAEFNERERREAKLYYNLFYGWHFRRGVPQSCTLKSGISDGYATLKFIKRLVSFFVTL